MNFVDQKWENKIATADPAFYKLWIESENKDIVTVLDTYAGQDMNKDVTPIVAKYEMRIVHNGKKYVRGLPKRVFDSISIPEALSIANEWVTSHQPLV